MPPLKAQSLTQSANIMIVDDNPANLKLLEDMLLQSGSHVRSFPRGRLALAAATMNPPDLFLLDINMPEMSGYELCEQLQSRSELSDIPVIFLSALNETEDKVKAFRAGAVDYISKPFQFEEVHARVDTHLKLHHLSRALKLQNEHLEETVAARTRDLTEANRRLTIVDRSKNEFLALISHEFRTPLNGVLGVCELALMEMSPDKETAKFQEMFELSRQRILSLLDDALLLTQISVNLEQFRCVPVSLQAALNRAVEAVAELAASRTVTLTSSPGISHLVSGDEDLLVSALQALLKTAIKFSEAGGRVRMSSKVENNLLCVAIESHTGTIAPSVLPKFFDLFSFGESSTPGADLGLGPAVAYRILSLFGASLTVENRDPSGIRLTLMLKPHL